MGYLDFKLDEVGAQANRRFEATRTAYTDIRNQRAKALNYYRQIMPDMVADSYSSNVCTSEVRDTVEAILPQVLEPFVSGDAVVFSPNSKEDDKQARLETAYTNHVIMTQNDGFNLFATWFKDALLQKNGYVKCYWDRRIKEETEEYNGIGYLDLPSLYNTYGGQAQVQVQASLNGQPVDFTMLDEQSLMQTRFDVRITFPCDESQVEVQNVAPENLMVDANHTEASLENCNYLCEIIRILRAEARLIPNVNADILPPAGHNMEQEENARKQDSNAFVANSGGKEDDLVELREHYMRSDLGMGLKMYRILTAENGTTFSVEEVDRHPYHCITPIQQPHQHFGVSVADMTMDLQRMSTSALRTTMDSAIRSTYQRPVIAENAVSASTANDLMSLHPMAPILVKDINGLTWTAPPSTIGVTLPLMEKINAMREERTGLSREAQGLDATALANSTNLVGSMVMNQALQRIKLILRTFAETGVRSLMLHVRELVLKNESRESMFELGGEFVALDVREWKKQRNTKVKVGVGVADKLERLTAMREGIAYQEKIVAFQGGAAGPLVTAQNIYNLLDDYYSESGLIGKDRYLTNPETIPPAPKEDSTLEDALQIEEAKVVFDSNLKAANFELDKFKALGDYQIKAAQAGVAQFKAMAELPNLNNESMNNG